MFQAIFYFEGQLNDFVPHHQRQIDIIHRFKNNPSIKDTIEALGVPHPEVNIILVNNKSVDFSYSLQNGDYVIVYPFNICPISLTNSLLELQPPKLEKFRFILDVHLGKLASLLRLLGFDTLYRNDYDDAQIAQISAAENRITLTRDKGLLMRKQVKYGYYVRQNNPEKQSIEVFQRFDLKDITQPFTRCVRCNGIIKTVEKAAIIQDLPEQVRQYYYEFYQCNHCHQIYWPGTHYQKMQEFVTKIMNS